MNVIEKTDPVCGMDVVPEQAAGRSEFNGTTYYFCSQQCKANFDRSPEQYARRTA